MRWILLIAALLLPCAVAQSLSEREIALTHTVSGGVGGVNLLSAFAHSDAGDVDIFPIFIPEESPPLPAGGGSSGVEVMPQQFGWGINQDGISVLVSMAGAVIAVMPTTQASQQFNMSGVPGTADFSLETSWWRDVLDDDGGVLFREIVLIRTYRRAGEKHYKTIRRHQDANKAMNHAGYTVGVGQ